jgi:pimeloyl-ACP methyl ester carboxylesterase
MIDSYNPVTNGINLPLNDETAMNRPHPLEMIGQSHVTQANGTSVAWGEMGAGEPLILLHGIWDSHRCWRRVAPMLAAHFRVLLPDLPGHGLSGRPNAPYTLAWYAQTMFAWMDALDIPEAHLCGHSFGGGVAQWMILENRRRINRLALVAAGGLGREVGLGLRLATFPLYGAILTPLVMYWGTSAMMRVAQRAFGHNEPDEIARHVRMTRIPGSARAFRRTVRNVINIFGQHRQTWQRIDEIAQLPPIAAFWGKDDPILPLHHGLAALERLDGLSLSIYPRCGHYPHLDSVESFTRELLNFLKDPKRQQARLRSANDKGIFCAGRSRERRPRQQEKGLSFGCPCKFSRQTDLRTKTLPSAPTG